MNIVILAGNYYPFFSANGNCINNIAQELKKRHNVYVISEKNDFSLEEYEEYNGIKIIRIEDSLTCFHRWAENKRNNSSNKIEKYFFNFLVQMKRIYFATRGILKKEAIDRKKIINYYNALKELSTKTNIDVIIPVILPVESAIATEKFRENHEVKVLAFQFDHFTEGVTINKFKWQSNLRYKRHLKIKKGILNKVDKLFILPQLEEFYKKEDFVEFTSKIIVSEHPLLKNINIKNDIFKFNSKNINLVFTGSLTKKYRTPEYLFKVIQMCNNIENIKLHMYTGGNCSDILEKYQNVMASTICNYGYVPLQDALLAMRKADILISIGVTTGNQVSGKIFDYFATGKPIIHFYYNDDDPNLVYFKQYKYALCLKINPTKISENCNLFSQFCEKYKGSYIPFDEVKKKMEYATPEFVTKQLELQINSSTL